MNRLAFGQDSEARLVDALRAGGFAPVSLVAEINGQVVGHIMFSRLNILAGKRDVQALALAPIAELPDIQRQGIGSILVRGGLEICKKRDHRIVVVLDHPDFYPRFGFSVKRAERLQSLYGGGPSHLAPFPWKPNPARPIAASSSHEISVPSRRFVPPCALYGKPKAERGSWGEKMGKQHRLHPV